MRGALSVVGAEAGTVRAVSVALLEAASAVLAFIAESWQRGLVAAAPARILEVNERALALGRDSVPGASTRAV
jgi:hypothetical protein